MITSKTAQKIMELERHIRSCTETLKYIQPKLPTRACLGESGGMEVWFDPEVIKDALQAQEDRFRAEMLIVQDQAKIELGGEETQKSEP